MKKLNNKGFSLVELIIVIAIMAILVGVVGTQVIPYLENSRKAKDQQILSAWNTAGVSAYSTEAGSLDATKTYTITIESGASIKINASATPAAGSGDEKLLNTFKALTDIKSGFTFANDMSSKAGKHIDHVDVKINGMDGQVVTTTTMNATGIAAKESFDVIENK